jgi:hypothetical protein
MKFKIRDYLEEEKKKQRPKWYQLLTDEELYELEMYLYCPDLENAGDRD